eukprot:266135_1
MMETKSKLNLDTWASKEDIQEALLSYGFQQNHIQRAFKAYERNYGHRYCVEVITEIIVRIQRKDKNKEQQQQYHQSQSQSSAKEKSKPKSKALPHKSKAKPHKRKAKPIKPHVRDNVGFWDDDLWDDDTQTEQQNAQNNADEEEDAWDGHRASSFDYDGPDASETQFYEQLFRSFDTQNFGTVQGG